MSSFDPVPSISSSGALDAKKKRSPMGVYLFVGFVVVAGLAGLAAWITYAYLARKGFNVLSVYYTPTLTDVNTASAETQIGPKYVAFQFPVPTEISTSPVIIDGTTYANFSAVPSDLFYWSATPSSGQQPANVIGVTFQYGQPGSMKFSTKTFVAEFTAEPASSDDGPGLSACWSQFASSLPAGPTGMYVAVMGDASLLWPSDDVVAARATFFDAISAYTPGIQINEQLASSICFCYAALPAQSSSERDRGISVRFYCSTNGPYDPNSQVPPVTTTRVNQGVNYQPLFASA